LRRRTKQEALDRIDSLPEPPQLPLWAYRFLPPTARFLNLPTILDKGGKAGARALVRLDPLNRLSDDLTLMEAINDPDIVMDVTGDVLEAVGATQDAIEIIEQVAEDRALMQMSPREPVMSRARRASRSMEGRDVIRRSGQFARQFVVPNVKPRKKNKKHCKNLSECLRQANSELRTKKGSLRKGKTQADVMRRAQRLMKKK
jgi:hypothetical protein